MRRVKAAKSWAIRRHKNEKEFEYLGSNFIWGSREKRREFKILSEALAKANAYKLVGVRCRVVPYGERGD